MNRVREWTLLALVAIAAATAGYGYHVWRTAPQEARSDALVHLGAQQFPDLDGKLQSIDQWQGKVLVVNFWATWCTPCREEIPVFVRLQERLGGRGLQFVGIAIDHPDKVRPYAAELGMNFPVLMGGVDIIDVMRALGNRAGVLPYTLVIDRTGRVVAAEIGAAKEDKLAPLVSSLL